MELRSCDRSPTRPSRAAGPFAGMRSCWPPAWPGRAGNYAFNVVMAFLEPEAYGALAALLALVLVGSVPGLALQAVVARRTTLARAAWPGVGWLVGRARAGLVLLILLGPGWCSSCTWTRPCRWRGWLALAPTPLLFATQGSSRAGSGSAPWPR